MLINDKWAGHYAVTLEGLGFTIRNWIIWYETVGEACCNKFNSSSCPGSACWD